MKLESDVMKAVCKYFSVNEEDILGECRRRELVYARAAAAYFLRNKLLYSLNKTGARIRKDHSTVVHYMHLVDGLIEIDVDFTNKFNKTEKSLNKKYLRI